ncbi:MAG: hypothetical protein IT384_19370 [Deltaproteobacteria bacterium]|nr:hypothetical protein [Deltaproteobacteria bacterium]
MKAWSARRQLVVAVLATAVLVGYPVFKELVWPRLRAAEVSASSRGTSDASQTEHVPHRVQP